MSTQLTIAIAKGYLLTEGLNKLNKIGLGFNAADFDDRKLFITNKDKSMRILQVRPWDVSAYVAQGAADLGIVGKDVLEEKEDQVLRLLDLKFGYCRLVIAGPKSAAKTGLKPNMVVATKYADSAKRFFQKKGLPVQLVKLYGAIELGPLTGLSDIICDLTATGTTLREHGLVEMETILESSAYLVANPVSMAFFYDKIVDLVERLSRVK